MEKEAVYTPLSLERVLIDYMTMHLLAADRYEVRKVEYRLQIGRLVGL